MKNIFIVLIIIIIISLISYNHDNFKNYKHNYDHEKQKLNKYKLLSKDDLVLRELLQKNQDDELVKKFKEYSNLKNYLIKTNLENVKYKINDIKSKYNKNKKELEILLYSKFKPNLDNYYEKNNDYYEQLHNFMNNYIIQNKFKDENVNSIKRCITNGPELCYYVLSNYLIENEKKISLTRVDKKNNLYTIDLNNLTLEYNLKDQIYDKTSQFKLNETEYDPLNKHDENYINKFYFLLQKIININQLNSFMINEDTVKSTFKYPLYILVPYNYTKHLLTMRNNELSLEPINNDNLKNQIFYISFDEKICRL